MAKLPLSCFGFHRMERDGHFKTCSECRAQYHRLLRKAKYNSKSLVDDSLIRNVSVHNEHILTTMMSIPNAKCIGFIPHTDKVFRVHFGRSRYDMESMAVFSEGGESYFEIAYSNIHDSLGQLMLNLKKFNIRLEFSVVEMMASKNVLYHLWKA